MEILTMTFGANPYITFFIQSWITYTASIFFILLRMYARISRLGVKGLQADDYLMVLAGTLYTTLVVCFFMFPEGGIHDPENRLITGITYQSKVLVVIEQAMLNLIYVIKACMLIIYNRLTLGLQVRKILTYLAAYVVVGWFATQIAFFIACRPFKGYWDATIENPQCTTLEYYATVQACFNISSDIMMLAIPLPLLIKLNVPLKQKLVLLVIFSMGILVIVAALLSKIVNLTDLNDPTYSLWYIREASVAIYVSNLPLIWPMLQDWFSKLKALVRRERANTLQTAKYDDEASNQKLMAENPDFTLSGAISKNTMITIVKGQGEVGVCGVASELETDAMQSSSEPFVPSSTYHGLHNTGLDVEDGKIHMTRTVHVSEEHLDRSSTVSKERLITYKRSESPEIQSSISYSFLKD